MTISDRDRRILLILLPVIVLLAYWFLILSPKRSDLKTAQDRQSTAEQERDAAVALAAQLEKARASFATDYAAVVRLGKAIPATIDSPSLLVQLDRAADGTHIDLSTVTFGERGAATTTTTTTTGATGTSGPQPQGNAAAGGAPAQTQPGQQAEAAGNAANQANQANAAATDTTVSTTAGAATPTPAAPAALDQVEVTFNFTGSYFDLADFFHRMKRFVYVANNQIFVRGRLIQISSVSFAPGTQAGATDASKAGDLTATVTATVYLSPKAEGATGGATTAGPSGTTTTTPPPGQTAGNILPTAAVGAR